MTAENQRHHQLRSNTSPRVDKARNGVEHTVSITFLHVLQYERQMENGTDRFKHTISTTTYEVTRGTTLCHVLLMFLSEHPAYMDRDSCKTHFVLKQQDKEGWQMCGSGVPFGHRLYSFTTINLTVAEDKPATSFVDYLPLLSLYAYAETGDGNERWRKMIEQKHLALPPLTKDQQAVMLAPSLSMIDKLEWSPQSTSDKECAECADTPVVQPIILVYGPRRTERVLYQKRAITAHLKAYLLRLERNYNSAEEMMDSPPPILHDPVLTHKPIPNPMRLFLQLAKCSTPFARIAVV